MMRCRFDVSSTTGFGRLARWMCLVLTIFLAVSFLAPGCLWSQDSRGVFKDYVDSLGKSLYFLAWPTAQYEGVSFGEVTPNGDGADVSFRLYGKSAFDDSSLWVDVVIVVRNGQIADLRWGRNNAILAQPGSTVKAMGEALAQLNEQYQRDHRPSIPTSSGFAFLFHNECNRPVRLAIHYQDLSGQWLTDGWWQFGAGGSGYLETNGSRLKSNSAVWYYYAETTDDNLEWAGDDFTAYLEGRTLRMKGLTDKQGDSEWSSSCP
jgi:hypothetical protein